MLKKPREKSENTYENSILGEAPVLTAQQRKQKEKEEKAREKAERKRMAQQMRAEAKARVTTQSDSRQMTVIIVAMIALVVLCMVFLAVGQSNVGGREPMPDRTYFLDNTALPEPADEGISAAITEAYYTKNGGMYISFNFANAEPTTQHPTMISVRLMNGKGQVIAAASTTGIHKDYYLVGDGEKSYQLFIPKKYVKIADDPLSEISYEVTVECEDYHDDEEE